MRRQIQGEWNFLMKNNSRICVCAVLTAFCGILMWVHGSMAPWIYRYVAEVPFTPVFTVFFLAWLLLYGLTGFIMGIFLLPVCFRSQQGLRCSVLCGLSFILMLAWYPLFFSVLHGFLAFLTLFCAFLINICLTVCTSRYLKIVTPFCIFTALLEIYFLYVTIAFILLN